MRKLLRPILVPLLLLCLHGAPALGQQIPPQELDKILERADKLFEESKAAYQNASSKYSVEAFVDAGFKLEDARIKYLVLQEIGTADLQKTAADRLRAVNQLGKLIHDGKVAITGRPAEQAPAKPADPAPESPKKDPPAPDAPLPVKPHADVSKRAPIPDAGKQRDVEKQIRELFKEQYSKKAPADRKALLRLLLEQAAKSQEDPAALWVLCKEAQEVAAQICDASSAVQSVDLAARYIDIDATSMKIAVLTAAGRTAKTAEEMALLASAQLKLVDELIREDQYEAADKLAASSIQQARNSKDAELLSQATARAKEVAEMKTLFQSMKSVMQTQAKNPDDPGANLEIGRFLCFVKGSWDLGLRFFVKGSDPALKALAEKDLTMPSLPADCAALADGWYGLGEKERSPLRKSQLLAHARSIYESAMADAPPLLRARIEKRMAEIDSSGVAKDRLVLDLGGGVRMEFVSIKPGTFTMGSKDAAGELDEREHKVTITRAYSLGKYEVTRAQFAAFVKATGYKTDAEKEGKSWGRVSEGNWRELAGANWKNPIVYKQTDDHPVTSVGWNDTKAFCEWLSKKTGRKVRLPTEAEWEYACRAGAKTRWSFGDDESAMGEFGWYDKNSGWATHPVGQKKPNAWGLHDMHGNVWEWCEDWAAPYGGDVEDPSGPAGGDRRIMRGGSWDSAALPGRAAARRQDGRTTGYLSLGFRVCVQ